MDGFKTRELTNVVVNANDRFSAGVVAMDVGAMTEEINVTSRVTELQTTSGERSFTLESEALKNIANNGRALFNFATLVPGALRQGMSGEEIGSVGGFTVNGQRPNSNNITIDGVANIDTGDNGGNMATTNIDAVAEFKVLTNAYQAEYGRAVGGQLQVVTKSGSRNFSGSGYWYGRRSDWNANTWINKRVAPEVEKPETSRNDSGYTFGGPVFVPGAFNTDKTKLFFFWSQEHQRRSDPPNVRETRVPTALERRGDFSQSVDSSGNPANLHPRSPARAGESRMGLQRDGYTGLLRRRRRARTYPAESFVSTRSCRTEHLPGFQLLGRQRPQLHQPGPQQRAAARGSAADGLPGEQQLAGHRPLHEDEGRDRSRRTARRGPATAAINSRCRRSSCIPARTTCCPPPVC